MILLWRDEKRNGKFFDNTGTGNEEKLEESEWESGALDRKAAELRKGFKRRRNNNMVKRTIGLW